MIWFLVYKGDMYIVPSFDLIMAKILVLCCLVGITAALELSQGYAAIKLAERNGLTNGGRIVGGEPAALGQFPYQVSVRYNESHSCGGSILDEKTILCAAHCVDGRDAPYFTVVPGIINLNEEGVEHKVSSFVKHADYRSILIHNDISILKLATPIEYNENVQPVVLPTADIGADEEVILSGWGRQQYPGPVSDTLQFANLLTISREECDERQPSRPILDSQVCTFTRYGQGACHGDSGGPLVDANRAQIGIVSWGTPCGVGDPDVFTKVYAFLDWIAENRN